MSKPININELVKTVKSKGLGFGGIERDCADEKMSDKDKEHREFVARMRANIRNTKRIGISRIPDSAVAMLK